MSIVGIGTDLVAVSRLEAMQRDHGDRLARRLLADSELGEYQRLMEAGPRPAAAFLARRFAAKEAAAKALGCGIGADASFRDLVVGHSAAGAPTLELAGAAARRADALGIRHTHLSISDERDYALAMVVMER